MTPIELKLQGDAAFARFPHVDGIADVGEVRCNGKFVSLVVDMEQEGYGYAHDVLPRLTALLRRDPLPGDRWHRGDAVLTYVPAAGGGVWMK